MAWRSCALGLARAEVAGEARLHAQITVQAFYGRLGFTVFGPELEEDGILHIAMRRALTRPEPPGLNRR